MQQKSYFIWNGIYSRDMGVLLEGRAPIVRPEERVTHVQIPGKSGDVTETEGQDVYNAYIQTVSFGIVGTDRVNALFRWLRGDGYVTFSGEPDRRQRARVIGAITMDRVPMSPDSWKGSAQFYCQPLKEALFEAPVTLTDAGTITNGGDVPCYPVIIATPALGETTIEITVNGRTLTITDAEGPVRIDCAAQEVSDEQRTVLYTENTGGPFPVLAVGSNTVGGSGWASLEITKNARYL